MAKFVIWHTKWETTEREVYMSFNFQTDQEKLTVLSDVIDSMTSKTFMRRCRNHCVEELGGYAYHGRYGDTCPNCGSTDTQAFAMDAALFASFWELDMAKVVGMGEQNAVFTLPFDAWINTYNDSITIKLSDGFETWPLPPKDKWVFDLKQLYKGKRAKRFRIRKGAITAA